MSNTKCLKVNFIQKRILCHLVYMKKKIKIEKGIMTLDAAMAIFLLTALFYFVATSALLIRSEVILHTMTTNTAQELGQYSQLVTTLSHQQLENIETILNTVVSLEQLTGKNNVSNDVKKKLFPFNDSVDNTILKNDNYNIVENLKKRYQFVQFMAKQLFKQYIPGKNDIQKTIYLKRLGVLGGIDGLSFAHSKLIYKNKEWYIQIAMSCRLRGLYFQFLNYYHYIRHKIIVKVW